MNNDVFSNVKYVYTWHDVREIKFNADSGVVLMKL